MLSAFCETKIRVLPEMFLAVFVNVFVFDVSGLVCDLSAALKSDLLVWEHGSYCNF